jgi:hypothetical protein
MLSRRRGHRLYGPAQRNLAPDSGWRYFNVLAKVLAGPREQKESIGLVSYTAFYQPSAP